MFGSGVWKAEAEAEVVRHLARERARRVEHLLALALLLLADVLDGLRHRLELVEELLELLGLGVRLVLQG